MTFRLSNPVRWLGEIREDRRRAAWPEHSRLFLVGDKADWVLQEETRALEAALRSKGIRIPSGARLAAARPQSAYFSAIYQLLPQIEKLPGWRLGAAWYHGAPGKGDAEFDRRFDEVRRIHPRIGRLRVSNRAFRETVLQTGIDPAKVFLIPIGIDIGLFPLQTESSRREARRKHDLPAGVSIVGSFQKDGVGWEAGDEPKLIKGPDVFLKAMDLLRSSVPDLFVLLSGPARGYVANGLARLGIPFKHRFCERYEEVAELYQCLDAYLVASREEGGPKAVLESMASGVPLVSTRVGQAADLVRHGENGWIAEVEDAEGLAALCKTALAKDGERPAILRNARATAEAYAYERQSSLWLDFMRDFVQRDGTSFPADR